MEDLEEIKTLFPKQNDKKITEEIEKMVNNLGEYELLEIGLIKIAIEPKKEEEQKENE